MRTWLAGDYTLAQVTKALHRLDTTLQGRSPEVLWQEQSEEGEPEDDELLEQAAWVEEEEYQVLANYLDVRKKLQERRLGRGFFKPGEQPAMGTSKLDNATRLKHLKQKTKCARCGQVGHWAKECKSPPDGRGKQQPHFHGWMEQEEELPGILQEQDRGEDSDPTFFVGWQTQSQWGGEPWVGLTLEGPQAIVDTGAQCCVGGHITMQKLWREWKRRGLWISASKYGKAANGIGGAAKVRGRICMAAGVGQTNGVLDVTVLDGNVPLLIPVGPDEATGSGD